MGWKRGEKGDENGHEEVGEEGGCEKLTRQGLNKQTGR
jgi:hypothetical protein